MKNELRCILGNIFCFFNFKIDFWTKKKKKRKLNSFRNTCIIKASNTSEPEKEDKICVSYVGLFFFLQKMLADQNGQQNIKQLWTGAEMLWRLRSKMPNNMSCPMGKATICIGENKGADQLRGNREADQRSAWDVKPHFLKSFK